MNPEWVTLPMVGAIGVAIAGLIGAVASGAVLIIKALHEVGLTAGKIEVAVNSEKTAAQGRELTLKRENELLRELLTEQKATAGLLAQAATSRSRPADIVVTPKEEP